MFVSFSHVAGLLGWFSWVSPRQDCNAETVPRQAIRKVEKRIMITRALTRDSTAVPVRSKEALPDAAPEARPKVS